MIITVLVGMSKAAIVGAVIGISGRDDACFHRDLHDHHQTRRTARTLTG